MGSCNPPSVLLGVAVYVAYTEGAALVAIPVTNLTATVRAVANTLSPAPFFYNVGVVVYPPVVTDKLTNRKV